MTAIERVCDIIQTELELDPGQVILWDQKFSVPNDRRLYVAVSVTSCKPFSNISRHESTASGLKEVQESNFLATLGIDILSFGTDARDRKEEVIMALKSDYAQRKQEAEGFYIASISNSFVNLSSLEGSEIPYRFNIGVNVHYKVTKEKVIDYYNTHTKSVITEG